VETMLLVVQEDMERTGMKPVAELGLERAGQDMAFSICGSV
jgi:hypothetical protein